MTPITAESLRESGWATNGIYASKNGDITLRLFDAGAVASNLIDGCRWSSFGVVRTMEELAIVEEIVNRLYRE